ncbi:MAG: fumarate hydratase C-terminal domain-containing protein [Oscillospiraceae bacterium]|nr:fumarate hydratase C-terminal domain-containing protein [Oscillospiraceae bacterium]
MADYKLNTTELADMAGKLRVFDTVSLSGVVYTARDAAHKKIFELLDAGEPLPFPLKGSAIYYAGPTQTPPGLAIGSCGPTTSGRMDLYAPRLLDLGLCCMIGKGERNQAVRDAIVRNKGVYLCALGGAGALACKCIRSCEVIAFPELGCESVKRLVLEDFPLTVANDAVGGDIFIR